MTAAEAVVGLAPLVGSGGLGAIIIAWLGYKQQASKGKDGKSDPAATAASMGSGLAAGAFKPADAELITFAISQTSSALMRLGLVMEFRLKKDGFDREFEEFVTERELRAIRDTMIAEGWMRRASSVQHSIMPKDSPPKD